MTLETELRPEVQDFAREMERVLKLNDHKGGWINNENKPLDMLLELFWTKNDDAVYAVETRFEDTIYTAAVLIDLANYCMMVWDVHRKGLMGQL